MQENISQFESRKRDHLLLSLDQKMQAIGQSGFDHIHLVHEGIVDLNFEDIQIDSIAFGKKIKTPFYINAMTAGHADANTLNEVFAEAAQAQGWSLGLGSQRRELAQNVDVVDNWDAVKKVAPDSFIYSNIGAAQFIELAKENKFSLLNKLIKKTHASALAIHFNSLQEVLQIEGTPSFVGIWSALEKLANEELKIPIILKETGCGFSSRVIQKISLLAPLFQAGLVLDVAGKGGTHWGRMEGGRARSTYMDEGSENERAFQLFRASETFANWGESTVESLLSAKDSRLEVWASGGIRNGLDAAKSVALGAVQVGFAQPVWKAVSPFFYEKRTSGEFIPISCNNREKAVESLSRWMKQVEFEFRIALFCTGCLTIRDFQTKEGVWKQRQNNLYP